MFFGVKPISANESLRPSPLPNAVKCRKVKKSVKISEDSPGKSLMPPTFFGCHLRQKIDQKRHLSSRLSRIHFCDLIHGGGLVFVLYVIVASHRGAASAGIISTHASLAGRDSVYSFAKSRGYYFYPRVPCGMRPAPDAVLDQLAVISTHASLAGRDCGHRQNGSVYTDFYPRVPCGTRQSFGAFSIAGSQFLPTRPLRDATVSAAEITAPEPISTHASLAGRDGAHAGNAAGNDAFLPTRPLRDATRRALPRQRRGLQISTHASLAGRDASSGGQTAAPGHFYPRVPCGTRPIVLMRNLVDKLISTHASLAGRDDIAHYASLSAHLFLPTRPLRDATSGAPGTRLSQ